MVYFSGIRRCRAGQWKSLSLARRGLGDSYLYCVIFIDDMGDRMACFIHKYF